MTHQKLARRSLGSWRLALGMAGLVASTVVGGPARAWDLSGSHKLLLHGRDGSVVHLGDVNFTPQADGRSRFTLAMRHEPFKDFFLSMKEFKCLETPAEIFCHVPYPYPQPGTVSLNDLAWLEHALLFMFKTPTDFGAKLWNGVYYQLQATERGLVGRPQAVDLNRISAPPAQAGIPPYRPALRDDIPVGVRHFGRLSIE